jgi:hypothetical protein
MANVKVEQFNFRLTEKFNKSIDAFIEEWKEYRELTKTELITISLIDHMIDKSKKVIEKEGNAFYVHFNQEHFEVDDIEKAINNLVAINVAKKGEGNAGVVYLIRQLQGALLQQGRYEQDLIKYGDQYDDKRKELRINKRK